MITVLEYLVIAAAIGAVVFFIAVFVFGRGEQMAPLDPRTSPAQLPETGVTADDVRSVKFSLALRGYRMSDVDWTLERVSGELEELRRENAALRVVAGPSAASDYRADLVKSASSAGLGDGRQRSETTSAMASDGREGAVEPPSGGADGHGQAAGPSTLPEGSPAVPAPVRLPTRHQEPDQP